MIFCDFFEIFQIKKNTGKVGEICHSEKKLLFHTLIKIFHIFRHKHRRRCEKSGHQARSIDSLAQNGRVPVSNNTYTQLPKAKNSVPDPCKCITSESKIFSLVFRKKKD